MSDLVLVKPLRQSAPSPRDAKSHKGVAATWWCVRIVCIFRNAYALCQLPHVGQASIDIRQASIPHLLHRTLISDDPGAVRRHIQKGMCSARSIARRRGRMLGSGTSGRFIQPNQTDLSLSIVLGLAAALRMHDASSPELIYGES